MKAHIVYQKYLKGDNISDEELLEGYKAFRNAADVLSELGPVFKLACDEAYRVVNKFSEYIVERELVLP
jgi:hypothetical protein